MAVLLLAAPWTYPSSADDIAGVSKIIDGDTLEISGQRIRLHGIDAPEGRQYCWAHGASYPCGTMATAWLVNATLGKTVTCQQRDIDRYKRIVAVCFVGSTSLNDGIVRAGWALAYRQFSRDYVGAEDEARQARRGVWAGEFQKPWEWRRK